jgi:CRP/FNR family transcriptional regulator, anaerobic regulatory protein
MSELVDLRRLDADRLAEAGPNSTAGCCLPLRVVRLRAGEALFYVGQRKEFIFRVETGLLSARWSAPRDPQDLVEELGPEQVFGLGFLDTYIYDAVALVETSVSCWSKAALSFLEELDPLVLQRQGLETEREFVHRREALTAGAPLGALRRLAGFLCVASRVNATDGRDPLVIDESVDCASVASFLRIDVDELGQALVALQKKGLVAFDPPHGLRLHNIEALQLLVGDHDSFGA